MALTGREPCPYPCHQAGIVPQIRRGQNVVTYLVGQYLGGKLFKLKLTYLLEAYHNRMVVQPYHGE